ncbi:MAG TPA: ATP-binding protein [Candidatus Methylomirabilis sp.]|jgi:signal transduction histidine kinase
MHGWFENLRLRTKLVAMMFLLLLLSLASLFTLYWQAERRLVAQVERHTTDLSTAIRVSVEQLTSKGRTTEARLQDYVQRLERRGVREISILSNEREVIASSNPGRVGARIDPRQRDLLITARLGEEAFGEREQKTYNLIVPITVGAQRRGYILVSMILDDFATLLRVNLLKRIFLTIFVFAVGIAGSLALAWRVTRPIHQVVEAARRVASGDLSLTLPAERRDEIGELERSFNEMVERLRANRALEARLHQAERLSAIGQLASGIAHEVRNPLNFINLSIDFLRSRYAPAAGADREEFDRLVESVKKEVHRLNGMIENFLILGKPLKLDRKPCRVEVLLDDVGQVARQKAAAQQIQVEAQVAAGLPAVVADAAQLKTCFMNLTVNAFQAMPRGGRLQIAATPVPGDGGGCVGIEVAFRDTGGGIPAEDLPRVFEPYFTTKEAGIGLGLAITKKIVEEHGGSIGVESRPGEGTRVAIVLPVADSAATVVPVADGSAARRPAADPAGAVAAEADGAAARRPAAEAAAAGAAAPPPPGHPAASGTKEAA